jgi:XTP/dITP diphosphohydrolase
VREIIDLLTPFGIAVKGAAELGLAEPEETGTTFAENAILKARAAATREPLPMRWPTIPASALPRSNGAPGIYSARWAGEEPAISPSR